jgi:hypothetical protein
MYDLKFVGRGLVTYQHIQVSQAPKTEDEEYEEQTWTN